MTNSDIQLTILVASLSGEFATLVPLLAGLKSV